MSEAEKEPYVAKATEDKARYQTEFKAEAERQGISEAELRSKESGKGGQDEIGITEVAFPIARVKKICKLDPEVKNLSKDATMMIAKATEFFLAKFAEDSYKVIELPKI